MLVLILIIIFAQLLTSTTLSLSFQVDCTDEEFEICCDVERLQAAGLEQEL